MPWKLEVSGTFKRGYKTKSETDKKRVRDAITDLVNSPEPRAKGSLKHASGSPVYAYEIGAKYRLLYDFDERIGTLRLHRVCHHEEVYL